MQLRLKTDSRVKEPLANPGARRVLTRGGADGLREGLPEDRGRAALREQEEKGQTLTGR